MSLGNTTFISLLILLRGLMLHWINTGPNYCTSTRFLSSTLCRLRRAKLSRYIHPLATTAKHGSSFFTFFTVSFNFFFKYIKKKLNKTVLNCSDTRVDRKETFLHPMEWTQKPPRLDVSSPAQFDQRKCNKRREGAMKSCDAEGSKLCVSTYSCISHENPSLWHTPSALTKQSKAQFHDPKR